MSDKPNQAVGPPRENERPLDQAPETETQATDDAKRQQHRGRDSLTLGTTGSFFTVISLLVLAGNLFGEATRAARIANLAAGGVLLAIGVAMVIIAWRMRGGGHDAMDETKP